MISASEYVKLMFSSSDRSLHGVCLCEKQWDPDYNCGRWAKASVSTHYSHNWLKVWCYRWLSYIRVICSWNGDQNVRLSSLSWIKCIKEFRIHLENIFHGCYFWSLRFWPEKQLKKSHPLFIVHTHLGITVPW